MPKAFLTDSQRGTESRTLRGQILARLFQSWSKPSLLMLSKWTDWLTSAFRGLSFVENQRSPLVTSRCTKTTFRSLRTERTPASGPRANRRVIISLHEGHLPPSMTMCSPHEGHSSSLSSSRSNLSPSKRPISPVSSSSKSCPQIGHLLSPSSVTAPQLDRKSTRLNSSHG